MLELSSFLTHSHHSFKMSSVGDLTAQWPLPVSEKTEEHIEDTLSVVDNRTGLSYNIPITQNSIQATDFHHIKSPRNAENPVEQNNAGIRVFDPGFQNTACMESKITYVDGDAGEIAYRGIPVAELFYSGRPFEHVAFLLIFGHLPSDSEAKAFNTSIATSEMPPQTIFDTINNLPYVVQPSYTFLDIELTFQGWTRTPPQPSVPPLRFTQPCSPKRSRHTAGRTSTRETSPL